MLLRPRYEQPFPNEPVVWLCRAGKIGFAAKAFVYGAVGGLALLRAVGWGRSATDAKGALSRIWELPGGGTIIWPLALGLIAYAVWRVLDSVVRPRARGLACFRERVGAGGSAAVYGWLAFEAVRIAIGNGDGGSTPVRAWAAEALGWSFGPGLLVGAALAAFAFAGCQLHALWTGRFLKLMEPQAMTARRRRAALWVGRAGLGARATLFVVVGVHLLRAGLDYDSSKAAGIGQALESLGSGPHGGFVLGAMAVGLLLYAAECVLLALELRIRRPG